MSIIPNSDKDVMTVIGSYVMSYANCGKCGVGYRTYN